MTCPPGDASAKNISGRIPHILPSKVEFRIDRVIVRAETSVGNRLPVAILGDGDFMMSASAFWTAAHYRIPFLAVVCNNRSFYNDEVHQERVAAARQRPAENKWIGQRISDPDIDIAGLARAQGCEGIGPAATVGELTNAVAQGVALARAGKSVIVDAVIKTGYNPGMVAGLTRGG